MDELLLSDQATRSSNPFALSHLSRLQETRILISDPLSQSSLPSITPASSSFLNLLSNLSKKPAVAPHRSHSAPSLFTNAKEPSPAPFDRRTFLRSTPPIVSQAFLGVVLYICVGVAFFVLKRDCFYGRATFRLVDALYYSVVTLCTIGYGDIAPATASAKLFTCGFILVGFGFVDILLNGLVTYVLDRQEAVLLGAVLDVRRPHAVLSTYVMDLKTGRVRIRMKVGLALAVAVGCIGVGTVTAHVVEGLDWVDSFYLSVTSVTTVGYGDYGFKTVKGRLFATVWLLVSTLAVARAFLYLTELRIDKRNRTIAKWVLQKKMSVGDLVAADLDNDGSLSKSEYVIYKLKEMGKIADKDILQICNQFDKLEAGNYGKITLSDLMKCHP